MGEAHERVHQGELPRVVKLEAGDALSRWRDGRFCELSQLATINEGLQNILLYVQVVVVDRRKGIAETQQILHRFVHAVIVDVVAGCLEHTA